MYLRCATGEYAAGAKHAEVIPRKFSPGSRLVIWCHEHGASGWTWPNVADAQARLSIGSVMPAASGDIGGPSAWGNPASRTGIDQLWTFMVNKYGVKSDKVLLIGGSMGGLTVLNYMHHNPTKVQAAIALIPAINLQLHHDDPDTLGWEAEVDAAYGGHAGYLAARPEHSPYEYMNAPAGVPLSIWYSDNDTTTPFQYAIDYGEEVGAELHSLGSVGHGFGPASFDRGVLAQWLLERA